METNMLDWLTGGNWFNMCDTGLEQNLYDESTMQTPREYTRYFDSRMASTLSVHKAQWEAEAAEAQARALKDQRKQLEQEFLLKLEQEFLPDSELASSAEDPKVVPQALQESSDNDIANEQLDLSTEISAQAAVTDAAASQSASSDTATNWAKVLGAAKTAVQREKHRASRVRWAHRTQTLEEDRDRLAQEMKDFKSEQIAETMAKNKEVQAQWNQQTVALASDLLAKETQYWEGEMQRAMEEHTKQTEIEAARTLKAALAQQRLELEAAAKEEAKLAEPRSRPRLQWAAKMALEREKHRVNSVEWGKRVIMVEGELEAERTRLAQQLETHSQQKEEMEAERVQLSQQLQAHSEQMQQLEGERERLEQRADESSQREQEKEAELEQLSQQLQAHDEQVLQLESERAQLEQRAKESSQREEEKEAERVQLSQQLQAFTAQMQQLESESAQLEQRAGESNEREEEKEAERIQLSQQLQEYSEQMRKLEETQAQLAHQAKESSQREEETEADRAQLSQQLQAHSEHVQQLESERAELEQQAEESRRCEQEKEAERAQLSQQLAAYTEQIHELQNEQDGMSRQLGICTQREREIEEERARLEAAFAEQGLELEASMKVFHGPVPREMVDASLQLRDRVVQRSASAWAGSGSAAVRSLALVCGSGRGSCSRPGAATVRLAAVCHFAAACAPARAASSSARRGSGVTRVAAVRFGVAAGGAGGSAVRPRRRGAKCPAWHGVAAVRLGVAAEEAKLAEPRSRPRLQWAAKLALEREKHRVNSVEWGKRVIMVEGELEAERTRLAQQLETHSQQKEEMEAERVQLSQQLQAHSEQMQQLEGERERLEQRADKSSQREQEKEAELEQLSQQLQAHDEQVLQLESERAQLEQRAKESSQREEEKEAERVQLSQQLQAFTAQMQQLESESAQLEQRAGESNEREEEKEAERIQLSQQLQEYSEQMRKLEETQAQLAHQAKESSQREEETEADRAQLSQQLQAHSEHVQQLESERAELEQQAEESRRCEQEKEAERAQLSQQLAAYTEQIHELQNEQDGMSRQLGICTQREREIEEERARLEAAFAEQGLELEASMKEEAKLAEPRSRPRLQWAAKMALEREKHRVNSAQWDVDYQKMVQQLQDTEMFLQHQATAAMAKERKAQQRWNDERVKTKAEVQAAEAEYWEDKMNQALMQQRRQLLGLADEVHGSALGRHTHETEAVLEAERKKAQEELSRVRARQRWISAVALVRASKERLNRRQSRMRWVQRTNQLETVQGRLEQQLEDSEMFLQHQIAKLMTDVHTADTQFWENKLHQALSEERRQLLGLADEVAESVLDRQRNELEEVVTAEMTQVQDDLRNMRTRRRVRWVQRTNQLETAQGRLEQQLEDSEMFLQHQPVALAAKVCGAQVVDMKASAAATQKKKSNEQLSEERVKTKAEVQAAEAEYWEDKMNQALMQQRQQLLGLADEVHGSALGRHTHETEAVLEAERKKAQEELSRRTNQLETVQGRLEQQLEDSEMFLQHQPVALAAKVCGAQASAAATQKKKSNEQLSEERVKTKAEVQAAEAEYWEDKMNQALMQQRQQLLGLADEVHGSALGRHTHETEAVLEAERKKAQEELSRVRARQRWISAVAVVRASKERLNRRQSRVRWVQRTNQLETVQGRLEQQLEDSEMFLQHQRRALAAAEIRMGCFTAQPVALAAKECGAQVVDMKASAAATQKKKSNEQLLEERVKTKAEVQAAEAEYWEDKMNQALMQQRQQLLGLADEVHGSALGRHTHETEAVLEAERKKAQEELSRRTNQLETVQGRLEQQLEDSEMFLQHQPVALAAKVCGAQVVDMKASAAATQKKKSNEQLLEERVKTRQRCRPRRLRYWEDKMNQALMQQPSGNSAGLADEVHGSAWTRHTHETEAGAVGAAHEPAGDGPGEAGAAAGGLGDVPAAPAAEIRMGCFAAQPLALAAKASAAATQKKKSNEKLLEERVKTKAEVQAAEAEYWEDKMNQALMQQRRQLLGLADEVQGRHTHETEAVLEAERKKAQEELSRRTNQLQTVQGRLEQQLEDSEMFLQHQAKAAAAQQKKIQDVWLKEKETWKADMLSKEAQYWEAEVHQALQEQKKELLERAEVAHLEVLEQQRLQLEEEAEQCAEKLLVEQRCELVKEHEQQMARLAESAERHQRHQSEQLKTTTQHAQATEKHLDYLSKQLEASELFLQQQVVGTAAQHSKQRKEWQSEKQSYELKIVQVESELMEEVKRSSELASRLETVTKQLEATHSDLTEAEEHMVHLETVVSAQRSGQAASQPVPHAATAADMEGQAEKKENALPHEAQALRSTVAGEESREDGTEEGTVEGAASKGTAHKPMPRRRSIQALKEKDITAAADKLEAQLAAFVGQLKMTTTTQLEPSVSGEDRQRTVSGGVGGMRELFSLRSQIIELDAEYQMRSARTSSENRRSSTQGDKIRLWQKIEELKRKVTEVEEEAFGRVSAAQQREPKASEAVQPTEENESEHAIDEDMYHSKSDTPDKKGPVKQEFDMDVARLNEHLEKRFDRHVVL
ncbi:hypothetical protein CYMTET_28403 [Cymbomonas tetramitiformis]|uniref:Uncharacterized protein n=1 Tax=Cymbomonas tetramitiformis TaxID=36881 RepID=A0AAE0KVZ2_9CHLO|nr:hypothetical protein CYMTET_28403 [Cymbomonas tetramitiformis]